MQGGHKQARLAIPLTAGYAGGRVLAEQEAPAVELFRRLAAQLDHETPDRVAVAGKPALVDQVLIDGHGVALEPQLGLDELAVGLARGGGRRHYSRWPRWSSLSGSQGHRVGGHPGPVCGVGGKALLVGTGGMARDAHDPFHLTLAGLGLQQRLYGGFQMWLQDIHSNGPLGDEGESNVLPVGQEATDTPR